MAIFLGAINENDLIKKRNKLYMKALKLFPNSPAQLKVRKEIEKINKQLTEIQ